MKINIYNISVLNNKIKLSIIGSSIILSSLVGCGKANNNHEYQNDTEKDISTEYITTEDTSVYSDEVREYNEEIITEEVIENTEENVFNNNESKDDEILNYFNDKCNNIYMNIEDINKDEIKQKCKDLFIELVDFIYYDKTIKGVNYSELKDGIKEQLYDDLCSINGVIDENIPDIKENISEKYYSIKEYIGPKYEESIDKIKEKIGDDNLEKIDKFKDDTKDKASDLFDKAKVKIKNKYEDFRDN